MAMVKDFRNIKVGDVIVTDGEPMTTVKVGDVVGFKSDHEQHGTVTRIEGHYLHLHNKSGFGGDYLRYATDTVVHAGDCWFD
jgi:hypothetical protein